MPVVSVNKIYCYSFDCEKTTPLLASTLEQKLGYRPIPSRDDIPILFGCPQCKHVAHSEIPFLREPLGIPAASESPDDKVPCVVLLECDQEGCESRIPVLTAMALGTSNSQVTALVREWQFDTGVTCSDGHQQTKAQKIVKLTIA